MTDVNPAPAPLPADLERIVAQLRDEFIDLSRESIAAMNARLEDIRDIAVDFPAEVLNLKRRCHNIKGQGTTYGFQGVSVIAHRMEDYLGGISHFGGNTIPEIFVFLDWMDRSLAARRDFDENELAQLVRRLPTPPAANRLHQDFSDREALLVIPSRFVLMLARSALEQFGIRCVAAASSVEGLVLAVTMRPDVVVLSAVMDGIDGIDLSRALQTMATTCAIPLCMITSLRPEDPALTRVPLGVMRIDYDRDLMGRLQHVVPRLLMAPSPSAAGRAAVTNAAANGAAGDHAFNAAARAATARS